MIRCGHCKGSHQMAETVRRCSRGEEVHPCVWLVPKWFPEDTHESAVECGASAWITDGGHGFECEAGHSHVGAETRMREGWDYAADDGEALALAKAGMVPVHMDGHVFV